METSRLSDLLKAYRRAPEVFQATSYWNSYEKGILETISKIDFLKIRSGKYPILATFGFTDVIYSYPISMPVWKKILLKFIRNLVGRSTAFMPYQLSLSEIRHMAFHHCELLADISGAMSISTIETSTFGNPADLFSIHHKKYTMHFLNYYVRYCFARKHISFKGDEIVVDLGTGSGYQIEVLKKLYPDLTVLCFDLPAQIFLCEEYLTEALNKADIVGTGITKDWKDLSQLKKGGIHFFGNWQFPLLEGFQFDLFWNAASFGEMEPHVVENYLSYIKGNVQWVYLLNARHGKETKGKIHVNKPITFENYQDMLSGYKLLDHHDAYFAHRRLSQSKGYFEALWMKE